MQTEAQTVSISYDNDAEGRRFAKLYPNSKDAKWAFTLGVEKAEAISVQSIIAGEYGTTAASIEAGIAHCIQPAGVKSIFKSNGYGSDEAFCYRIGYRSRSRMAKAEYLSKVAALNKANDAVSLIAAGMRLATEAFDLAGMDNPLKPASKDIASELGLQKWQPCPFAAALERAKRQGETAGRALALGAVERIRLEPHLRPALVESLKTGLELAAAEGQTKGMSVSEIASYQQGYFEGADPIVTEALKEWAAETGESLPDDALTRLKPVLVGSQRPGRPLRPEDFGASPTGLTRQ